MFARLGIRSTTAFPLPISIRHPLQLSAVDVVRLCPADFEMAEPAEPWPGQLTARRRYWVLRPSAETEGPDLAQAHSRISGQSF